MSDASLYIYNHTYELSLDSTSLRINGPMYDSVIKVYKEVNNTINFKVSDNHRRPVHLSTYSELMMYIVDPAKQSLVLKRPLVPVVSSSGTANVSISQVDIADIDPGLYTYSVKLTDLDEKESMAHTDVANGVIGNLEIFDGVIPGPELTLFAKTFTLSGSNYYSEPLPAEADRNYAAGLHTIASYLTDFTGKLYIEGSLDETTPASTSWFPIDPILTAEFIQYTSFTGIDPNNFIVNCNWLRFYYIPDGSNTGTFDKILLRN